MSTPVTLPKVQTQDRNINQLQNNVTNSLQSIGNKLNKVTIIGEIKLSPLTASQFQAQAGKGWITCDGSSIVGSELNQITGALVAPTIADLGSSHYYIRIN